ncbi:M23 family metallopeptidase [Microbacterium sediminis]|uniref:M23 family metallopeptidase n=1 Tax=Microbacterium sediminis TaxID=904291 RepID=UPI001071D325|nr:M23 family metallopeptidase [Microbacterium sediminis]QBR73305.1 M23 family peptidase [Microbacterium sediminis]
MTADLDADVCDCAPTAAERRVLWGPVSRRAALAAGGIAAAAAGIAAFATPAFAVTYDPDDYPSWADVEAARKNESAKAGEISRIETMIAQLKQRVAEAQAAAQAAADAYYEAQQAFYEAAYRADQLQAQADEQSAKADQAALAAARVASQISRTSGSATSLEVLFADSAENADQLLTKLGQMDKLAEKNESIYAEAVSARDAAQSLSDQAAVARAERDRLQKEAEAKMVAAQEAAMAAEQALADQEANLVTLEAQLAALKDSTAKTVADYQAGVQAKKEWEAEQERLRIEREKAAAAAREKAAQEAAQNSGGGQPAGGGGGGGGGGGQGPGNGWVRPSSGGWTSGYGPRYSQCGPSYCASSWHLGVDMAAGCGAPIYAAHSGTVTYAGYNGGYGNYVRIDHGGGVATGYGHSSRILVGWGQWVNAGQVIAYEGQTGNSFGCHLHFEVYVNGATVNPSNFMSARGVWL